MQFRYSSFWNLFYKKKESLVVVAGEKEQVINYLSLLSGFKAGDLFLIQDKNNILYQLLRLPTSSFVVISYPSGSEFKISKVVFRKLLDQSDLKEFSNYL